MRRFKKITNIILIFILGQVFLCSNFAYSVAQENLSLRNPLIFANNPESNPRLMRSRLINLTNDWRNWESNENQILRLTCKLLNINNISEFRPIRPIKPIVMAGGEGKRTKATGVKVPKVLAMVNGKPAIMHVLDGILSLPIIMERPIVIVNSENEKDIREALKGYPVDYVVEERPSGTGYGILQAEKSLKGFHGDVLVVYGCQPVVRRETIFKSIIIHQAARKSSMTLPTTVRKKPYAPLKRSGENEVIDSVETRSEGASTVEEGEDNLGVYIVRGEDIFETLRIAHNALFEEKNNRYRGPGELGFPNEMTRGLVRQGKLVLGLAMANPREQQGIKEKKHLALAGSFRTELVKEKIAVLRERKRRKDEHLMDRELVDIDLGKAIPHYDNKKVLIAGAAGSIGSILAEYLTQFNLKELILLDKDKESLIALERYLKTHYPFLKIIAIEADIRDKDKIEAEFRWHSPDFVFHAAANKYADQLENQSEQCEGLETNVIGTKNLIESSQRAGVDSFVFFSSDKAVTPPTFYGATKKVGELLMQAYRGNNTKFITARPSNFLGSQGSIIPELEEQIANGDVIRFQRSYRPKRYFVSMLEVAESVINIGALGESGEIYIVNFGKKIVINDLVDRLISFSGKKVKIKNRPLRLGDTLDIDLLTEEENKIVEKKLGLLTFKPTERVDKARLLKQIGLLEEHVRKGDAEKVKEMLKVMVPEYKHEEQKLLLLQGEIADRMQANDNAVNISI